MDSFAVLLGRRFLKVFPVVDTWSDALSPTCDIANTGTKRRRCMKSGADEQLDEDAEADDDDEVDCCQNSAAQPTELRARSLSRIFTGERLPRAGFLTTQRQKDASRRLMFVYLDTKSQANHTYRYGMTTIGCRVTHS
jgi:hypothetical protein